MEESNAQEVEVKQELEALRQQITALETSKVAVEAQREPLEKLVTMACSSLMKKY